MRRRNEGGRDLLASKLLRLVDALDGEGLGFADQSDDEDGFEGSCRLAAAASGDEPT